ncbi:MAG TPA: hypothetical protein VFO34_16115 [Candidatus Acidoferrales bacterium]|nr:hypothetical protein [Candidatus Acidoferrales bacterium]
MSELFVKIVPAARKPENRAGVNNASRPVQKKAGEHALISQRVSAGPYFRALHPVERSCQNFLSSRVFARFGDIV